MTEHRAHLGSAAITREVMEPVRDLVEPSVSGFACGTLQFGGCLVVLSGELVQQFQVSIGPVVRF